jgi:hypothetical protein
LEEARKCIESGGSDCVGESNTARKVIENPKEALEDLGDSVGKKTERALKDLRKIKLPKIERPPRIKVPKVKLPKL